MPWEAQNLVVSDIRITTTALAATQTLLSNLAAEWAVLTFTHITQEGGNLRTKVMWFKGVKTTVRFCTVELSIKGPLLTQTEFMLTCSQADKQLAKTDIVLDGQEAKGIPTLQLMHTVMSADTAKERQARASVVIEPPTTDKLDAVTKCLKDVIQTLYLPTSMDEISQLAAHEVPRLLEHEGMAYVPNTKGREIVINFRDSASAELLQRMQVLRMTTSDCTVTLSFMGDKRQQGLKHAISIKGILSGKLVTPDNMLRMAEGVKAAAEAQTALTEEAVKKTPKLSAQYPVPLRPFQFKMLGPDAAVVTELTEANCWACWCTPKGTSLDSISEEAVHEMLTSRQPSPLLLRLADNVSYTLSTIGAQFQPKPGYITPTGTHDSFMVLPSLALADASTLLRLQNPAKVAVTAHLATYGSKDTTPLTKLMQRAIRSKNDLNKMLITTCAATLSTDPTLTVESAEEMTMASHLQQLEQIDWDADSPPEPAHPARDLTADRFDMLPVQLASQLP